MGTSWSSTKRSAKSSMGATAPCTNSFRRPMKAAWQKKRYLVPVDTKLDICLVTKKTNDIACCAMRSVISRLSEVILSLITRKNTPKILCPVLVSHYKGDRVLLDSVQGWATKLINRLEHIFYEERLGLFSLENRRLKVGRILSICTDSWREAARKTELGSFQWCSVTKQEAVGTNFKTLSRHGPGHPAEGTRWTLRSPLPTSATLWSCENLIFLPVQSIVIEQMCI